MLVAEPGERELFELGKRYYKEGDYWRAKALRAGAIRWREAQEAQEAQAAPGPQDIQVSVLVLDQPAFVKPSSA